MRRALPSLNALRAFEATARLGRMTEAADALGVTHGAVSRQVRGLETSLGLRLFEGPRNRLVLTDAGRLLLTHLAEGFDRIETGVRLVRDEAEGTLDVSCLGTLALRWLIPRLDRFRRAHPAIEVRLTQSDAPVDPARERSEVAIRVSADQPPEGMVATTLFVETVGPVLSPRLMERDARPILQLPRLHTETRRPAWADWLAASGREDAREAPAGTVFDHFYFMLEGATGGLGVAIAPHLLVLDDLAAGRLVAPFGFVPSGKTYRAIRCGGRHHKADAFCRWLAEEAEATAAALTQGSGPETR
ncbi:LysR substrate-binding domain-containing protein [Acuticoccus sp. M5D2P5]|uniref:LysR substrate-binding domain-containing protein n=1 Tax=Acuticoccus kalidii TaxID=2910977 RepID=UPI001F30D439|nr:LysR substrate-binding domain-containing protein [Acuticoccus kalidii]MCF3935664.1 LysR substrate-binding domain-containing protein [Acuticoccus kalidii]